MTITIPDKPKLEDFIADLKAGKAVAVPPRFRSRLTSRLKREFIPTRYRTIENGFLLFEPFNRKFK